jgi:hypothetical protein
VFLSDDAREIALEPKHVLAGARQDFSQRGRLLGGRPRTGCGRQQEEGPSGSAHRYHDATILPAAPAAVKHEYRTEARGDVSPQP